MKAKYLVLGLVFIAIYGCSNNTATTSNKAVNRNNSAGMNTIKDKQNNSVAEVADSIKHTEINKIKVINANDPVCGMPLLRGFDDTTLYKGKLIGFCSKECKDNFLKKPTTYPIAAK